MMPVVSGVGQWVKFGVGGTRKGGGPKPAALTTPIGRYPPFVAAATAASYSLIAASSAASALP